MYITKYRREEEYIIVNQGDPDLKPVQFKLEDIPNDNEMINYNLPISQQIYRPELRPVKLNSFINKCKKIQRENRKQYPFINDVYNKELFSYTKTYEDIHEFIKREWERRLYGEWYWIGGKRTYLSGLMLYWLDYWYLGNQLPLYKDSNRRYFHFLTEAMKDPNCYGIIEVTKRRDGKSKRASCALYESVTRQLGGRGGIQSKNDDDAKDFFQLHVITGFKNMPFWFQPLHSYSKAPKAELFFDAGGVEGDDMSLMSLIDYKAAKPLAYDGSRLTAYISDEEGKLEAYDAYERWGKVKPTLRDHDGKIIGKSIHTTTVEDGGVYGMDRFKKLWDASSFHKRNALGETESGLWRLFNPAHDGLIVDRFGNSLIEESKAQLLEQRKLINKNSSTYAEEVRKNPMTIREAFTISADSCPFDKDILMKRVEYFFDGNPYVIQGDFLWKHGNPDGEVEFIPNKEGRFYVSRLLPDGEHNQYELLKGKKIPYNKTKYVAGSDTFNYDKTEGTGSRGGGAVFMTFNPVMEGNLKDPDEFETSDEYNKHLLRYKSERFICTYSYRPSTKDEYVEDMIKMCVYYGCFMFPEFNFSHVNDGFIKRGYGGYLLHKYDKKTAKFKSNSGDITNENTKDNLFRVMGEYVKQHGAVEFHDEILKEDLRVTYKTMTDYDLFTASCYALYGREFLNVWQRREEKINAYSDKNKAGYDWFEPINL